MIYTDLQSALDFVLLMTGLDESASDRLTKELTGTAGTLGNKIVYRPHYVIGMTLWLKPENNLISGEGVKLDQNFEVARRYFNMQHLIDTDNNLVVSKNYNAAVALSMVNPCNDCTGDVPGIPKIGLIGF